MILPVSDELILISGLNSYLLVGRAIDPFNLFLERLRDETVNRVEGDDLVAVSAPEGGPLEPAAMLLELVRRYHLPLVALPQGHPGSRRLPLVVAVAREITGSCQIQRGTHPEQHLLCASEELSGIRMKGEEGAIVLEGLPERASVRYIKPFFGLEFK